MLRDFLCKDCVLSNFRATSKKQVLQDLSQALARKTGLDAQVVFNKLLEREKLGSTAVGNGVAIPHARIEGLDKVTGFFARLDTPVDFDSNDDVPVDLIFVLVAPEGSSADHLKALSKVARLLRRSDMRDQLRHCAGLDEINDIMQPAPAVAA